MSPRALPFTATSALVVVLALAAFSCGDPATAPSKTPRVPGPAISSDPAPRAPDDSDDPPKREDGRLPGGVTPEHYSLALRIVPGDERFSGTVRIDVKLDRLTRAVVLHGANLHVTKVSAQTVGREIFGTSHTRAAIGARTEEELVLTFPAPLAPGDATLTIEYDAPFDKELSGLYRVKEKEHFYAFTQFEATSARRAFPCFDEPGWKTPFDVSIRAPWGLLAVANTREVDKVADQDGTVYRFATTRPLPTYLVAFAVGDFDVREGATSPVPIRAITLKGKKDLAGLALDATAKLLATMTDYMGVPYPFDKLDVVAVPDFAAGAMENAGLVTFREELLLLSDGAPRRQKRGQAQVIAHEIAHQWFGNLVTASWWDELFLNEGFATWMEDVATDRVFPTFGARLDSELEMDGTFDLDALPSTRAVRQPARTSSEIQEAFDGITYRKGAAILAMFESYLGRETFQRGVRDYLTRFAYKNATTRDLLASLETVSGKNLGHILDPLTDRAGVPLVRVQSSCEKNPARTKLTFELSEWLSLGEERKPTPTWTIPVCYQTDKTQGCIELGPGQPVTREEPGCAAFLNPNRDHGYYRYTLPKERTLALARTRSLDVLTRIELLSNAYASVRSGDQGAEVLFELLPLMDQDHERHVVQTVISILTGLSETSVSDAARPAFEAFVRARLEGHARFYARKKKPAEDDVLGKRAVEVAMGTLGNDTATNARLDLLARTWLRDHKAVDPDLAQAAVELASRSAKEARFTELATAMSTAKEPAERVIAVRGLAGFDDPVLLDRAFGLAIAGEIKSQDLYYMLASALGRRTSRSHATEYVLAHWDELRKRLPADLGPELTRVVGTACSPREVQRLTAFVEPRAKEIEGAERPFRAYAEHARQCVRVRERTEPPVTAQLTKKRR
jgi:aminopeptidase N